MKNRDTSVLQQKRDKLRHRNHQTRLTEEDWGGFRKIRNELKKKIKDRKKK